MSSSRSLTRSYFISVTLLFIFLLSLLSVLWINDEIRRFQKNSQQIADDYINAQKNLIKSEVDKVLKFIEYKKATTENRLKLSIKQRTYAAHQLCTNLYDKNPHLTKEAMTKLLHDALYNITWDNGKGYYFAETMTGKELVNRNNPELEEKNLMNVQDSKGTFIMREIINATKNSEGEGYCRYYWNKPNEPGKLVAKISFIKYFAPMDWVIGNGKYLEDEERLVKSEVIKWINSIRFSKGNYVFAGDYKGMGFCGPYKNQINLDLKDINGFPIVKGLIKKAQEGGGFIEYLLPGEQDKSKIKISYSAPVPGWDWYVGAGVYIDQIKTKIAEKQQLLRENLINFFVKILSLIFVMIIITYITTNYLANKLKKNMELFSGFFSKAATDSIAIDTGKISFNEFQVMAKAANQMISLQKKADEKRKLLEKKLQESQKMEAIGLMAGGVAHDLNNILSGISSYPELLLRKLPADSPLRKIVKTIQNSGERAAMVVEDLLTVARGATFKRTPEDLNQLITEYINSAEFKALLERFPEVRFSHSLAKENLVIYCSPVHINKSIMNLVTNAFESVQNDGFVNLNSEIIEINNKSEYQLSPGKYAKVTIIDNGEGIPEDKINKIFDPFFTKKEMGKSGTGLGLTIVLNTMTDHQGKIDVSSDSEQTTFTLYFPLTDVPVCQKIKEPDIQNFMGNGEAILIIDDELVQRNITEDFLLHLNYKCVSVSSGEEALELIKQKNFDLIILDMIMKNSICGRETYEEIIKVNSRQKVIIVSGFSANEDVIKILDYGFGLYLKKPYALVDLAKALRDLIEKQ